MCLALWGKQQQKLKTQSVWGMSSTELEVPLTDVLGTPGRRRQRGGRRLAGPHSAPSQGCATARPPAATSPELLVLEASRGGAGPQGPDVLVSTGKSQALSAALEPRGERCASPSRHGSNKPKSISPWAGGRASAADAAGALRGAERGNGNQMGPVHSWHLRSRAERALVAGSFPGVLVRAGSAGPTVPRPWVTLTRTLGVHPPGGARSAPSGGLWATAALRQVVCRPPCLPPQAGP